MGFVVEQGVAVGHHASRGIVAGDGQGITQRRGHRLREAAGHPAADYSNAADGQGLYAVQRRHREATRLSQRRRIRAAAVVQVLLVDGQFATFDVQTIEGNGIVEVSDVEHQVGGGHIAVSVSQGVGKSLDTITAAMQVEEVRIGCIERIGVGTISSQHQGAVGTDEGTGGNGPARHAVRALHIVAQYVAGQRQLVLGGDGGVGITRCRRHVIDNGNIDTHARAAAIGVGGNHIETLTKRVAAIGRGMRLTAVQGIAVGHFTGSRVVAADGQGIAQCGRERLREAIDHPAADHIDAANRQ